MASKFCFCWSLNLLYMKPEFIFPHGGFSHWLIYHIYNIYQGNSHIWGSENYLVESENRDLWGQIMACLMMFNQSILLHTNTHEGRTFKTDETDYATYFLGWNTEYIWKWFSLLVDWCGTAFTLKYFYPTKQGYTARKIIVFAVEE